ATLRVGTLNVNGLACKLSQVVDFANRHAIDILCLQETHLSAVTAPSAVAAARKAGWKLLVGSPAVDSTGRGTAGVAVLTQWPVAVGFISDGDQAGRWMTVFVHRPRFRPFEVVNLYLPASDKGQAQAMANQILQDAAARGTARFVIGDWNLTPWEEPVQTTHRCGALHLADDLLGQVVTGISDHDLVWYDLELSLFPAESFAKHLSDQDVEQAWFFSRFGRDGFVDCTEVRDWYPELSGLSFSERSDLSSVATCIEKERVAAQQGRIQQWKQRLDNSEAAAIDWVKRDLVDEPFEMGTPIHPQLKVSHVQSKWREVWNPPQMPAVADILPFQQHLNPGRQCDAVSFTAGALRRVVERGRHKAAGPDGWKPAHWALLPEGFFTAFASLWQVVYNTSVMPQAWLQIRCVLVPKGEAGGYRPISVASLAWRIGLTVVMQQLHPWLEAWLPSELCGGLRGKSTDDAHSTLHDDIVNALNNRSSVFGVKLDVSKCFDTVVPGQALHIWQRQGAPLAVVRLLGVFYSDSNRRFEYHGAVAAEAFSCKRGLLQGCPASCGLLAGIMALWRGYICHQAPSIRCSVYVDDRTVWTDTSCEVVASALEATAEVDEACGFRLNLSKCEGFATGVAKQRTLRRTLQERQLDWPVSGRFKLLGVVYNLTRRRRTPLNEKAAAKVLKRLTRVKLLSLDWHKKRRIIRAAVLSLFSFVGAWHTVSKAVLGKWRRQIELSVMKPVKGRSRFLLWAGLLGPELDPEFQLDFAALTSGAQ
ncbi:Pol, partial [Symbiodinium sp. KB8]